MFVDFVKWVFSRGSTQSDEGGSRYDGTDVDRACDTDTMILHLYAERRRDLQDARKKIDEYIEEESTRDVSSVIIGTKCANTDTDRHLYQRLDFLEDHYLQTEKSKGTPA